MRMELQQAKENFTNTLFTSNGFKIGQFELEYHRNHPDFPLSPYKISIREEDVLPGAYLPLCRSAADLIYATSKDFARVTDWIIGIPNAGNKIGQFYADLASKPLLIMEKQLDKDDRLSIDSPIYGDYSPTEKVFALDDVINRGGTKYPFRDSIISKGLNLIGIGVAVNREEGGLEEFYQNTGTLIIAGMAVTELISTALKQDHITSDFIKEIENHKREVSLYLKNDPAS
jgi:orotate phosphoribosyltransferase